jgi:hypothetical protein
MADKAIRPWDTADFSIRGASIHGFSSDASPGGKNVPNAHWIVLIATQSGSAGRIVRRSGIINPPRRIRGKTAQSGEQRA